MSRITRSGPSTQIWNRPDFTEPQEPKEPEVTPEELEEIRRLELEKEANEIRERAYTEGYEQGKSEAWQSEKDEIKQLKERLESITNVFKDPIDHLSEEIEQELAILSIAIAKQILRRELKIDPGQIIAVVKEALQSLPSASQDVKLYLNPDDVDLVKEIINVSASERKLEVMGDPVIERGGCKVETVTSEIDASIDFRVAEIAAVVMGGEREHDHKDDNE